MAGPMMGNEPGGSGCGGGSGGRMGAGGSGGTGGGSGGGSGGGGGGGGGLIKCERRNQSWGLLPLALVWAPDPPLLMIFRLVKPVPVPPLMTRRSDGAPSAARKVFRAIVP